LAKTDLGEKQICPSCGAKFYDLRKRPATCPKCATAFDPAEEGVRVRRGRGRVAAHDAGYEDDEELETKPKAKGDGDEDEESEDAAEVDIEAEAEPLLTDDDDEAPAGDDLPEGFSETDPELEDSAADDDSVPLLEDEEEFPEDEIGDIAGDKEDDESSR